MQKISKKIICSIMALTLLIGVMSMSLVFSSSAAAGETVITDWENQSGAIWKDGGPFTIQGLNWDTAAWSGPCEVTTYPNMAPGSTLGIKTTVTGGDNYRISYVLPAGWATDTIGIKMWLGSSKASQTMDIQFKGDAWLGKYPTFTTPGWYTLKWADIGKTAADMAKYNGIWIQFNGLTAGDIVYLDDIIALNSEPVATTTTAVPITTTTTAVPITTTTTAAPITTTTVAPPVTSTTVAPPVTSTTVAPPVTSTTVAPPVTSTTVAPPVTSTTVASPVTSTSVASPVTSTSVVCIGTSQTVADEVTSTTVADEVTSTTVADEETNTTVADEETTTTTTTVKVADVNTNGMAPIGFVVLAVAAGAVLMITKKRDQ